MANDDGYVLRRLRSEAVLILGEAHLQIVRANNKMFEACYTRSPIRGLIQSTKITAFGRQVRGDEIAWFVQRHAPQLEVIKQQTTNTHDRLQSIMRGAQDMRRRYEATTYEALVDDLRGFCDQHLADFQTFGAYVQWLRDIDSLAPSILFSFRVWGSTRVADRSFPTPDDLEPAETDLLNAAAYALGLRDRMMFTAREIALEASAAIADSIDPEEYRGGLSLTYESIRHRVANEVLSRLTTYLEQLRHSCREILRDAEKQSVLESLLHDQGFWCQFINSVVSQNLYETQDWDLKETLEIWHAGRDPNVETRFAERVAAFANADGGVFIVGVSDKPPRRVVGISDLENKIKRVFSVVDSRTNLPVSSLRIVPVNCDGEPVTVLIIAVARSPKAVWAMDAKGSYAYPVRRGPGLERMSSERVQEMKRAAPDVQDWTFLEQLVCVGRLRIQGDEK